MNDDRTVRRAMKEMGITVAEVAERSWADRSYVSRQLSGELPLRVSVKAAFLEVMRARAIACLPQVAELLRDEGEDAAAEACDRIWDRLGQADDHADDPPGSPG